jgi:hypothetical protein
LRDLSVAETDAIAFSDTLTDIIMKVYWKWKNENTDIEILTSQGERIGLIRNFNSENISTIGGKKFAIETTGVFDNIYIIDPLDKKAYCEYSTKTRIMNSKERFFKSPIFKIDFCFDNKTHCCITENKEYVIDFYKDKGWFKTTGNIFISAGVDNWELMIYCLFYGLSSYLLEKKAE